MSKTLKENERIPVSKVLEGANWPDAVDCVCITIDAKKDVRVFGTSGGKISMDLMRKAQKIIRARKAA